MVIITIVIIKLKLWPVAGCEAEVVAELSSRPLLTLKQVTGTIGTTDKAAKCLGPLKTDRN